MNKKCQVFTPEENVIELLDKVGYEENLYGSKIIENACGDGNILKIIVKRYIEDCLERNFPKEKIKFGLESDIYGVEIDKNHYLKCLSNLNKLAGIYGIKNVLWKLFNIDTLKKKLDIKFDYVVGNPPYIKYRDLDNETRVFLRENYETCKIGKFDYCYAFIEASLNSLNENGKLAYLIPNSIFKNVFAERLRNQILPYIKEIHDYKTKKLFNSALTSSAIIILDVKNKNKNIKYFDIVDNKICHIKKESLNRKWIFSNDIKKLKSKIKFSNYFKASISIATQLNEAFVIKEYQEMEKYIIVDNYKIEKKIIKETVSPRSMNYNKKELIIYPYYYDKNGNLERYEEEEFREKFPETTKYLSNFFQKLNERKSDASSKWFEYGRSQALRHLNNTKLLISTIVTKKVKVYELGKENIPYSGIYIISKNGNLLKKAKKVLESENFYNYVQNIGINASGTSLRITPADINNYEFCEEEIY